MSSSSHRRRSAEPLRVYFQAESAESTLWDVALEVVLAAVLVFGVAAFGVPTGAPWAEPIFDALVGVLAVVFVLRQTIYTERRWVWTWAYVPIAAFAALALVSVLPLPASIVRVLSPAMAALRSDLLADIPNAADALARQTLTADRLLTLITLRQLAAAATIFVIAAHMAVRIEVARRMLMTIVTLGVALAALTFAHQLTRATKTYWVIPHYQSSARGGPFVNPSHFAQYMNLCIGAAIALAMFTLLPLMARGETRAADIVETLRPPQQWPVYLVVPCILIGVPAIALSLSRMGMASAGVATLVAVMLSLRFFRGGGVGKVAALGALAAIAAVVFFGTQQLFERYQSLADSGTTGSRTQMIRDQATLWKQYPLLGTGLGTFAIIFPSVDRTDSIFFALNADNEYAQLMTETGVIGCALAAWLIGVIVVNLVAGLRSRRPEVRGAMIGIAYAFTAVALHSATDFAQRLPGVLALTATLGGVVIGMTRSSSTEAADVGETPSTSRLFRGLVLIPVFALSAWTIWHADRDRRAYNAWREANSISRSLERAKWDVTQATIPLYGEMLVAAEDAVRIRPDNRNYAYWLNYWRSMSITGWTLDAEGKANEAENEEQFGYVKRILNEIQTARLRFPITAPLYSLEGTLRRIILRDPLGPKLIRTAQRLSRNNPQVVGDVAELDADEGAWDSALANYRHAIAIGGTSPDRVARTLALHYKRLDLAREVAGDDVNTLSALATAMVAAQSSPADIAAVNGDLIRALRKQTEAPDAPAELVADLGERLAASGDAAAAIESYRRALRLRPSRNDWRLRLALLLEKQGQLDQAAVEASIIMNSAEPLPEAADLSLRLKSRGDASKESRTK